MLILAFRVVLRRGGSNFQRCPPTSRELSQGIGVSRRFPWTLVTVCLRWSGRAYCVANDASGRTTSKLPDLNHERLLVVNNISNSMQPGFPSSLFVVPQRIQPVPVASSVYKGPSWLHSASASSSRDLLKLQRSNCCYRAHWSLYGNSVCVQTRETIWCWASYFSSQPVLLATRFIRNCFKGNSVTTAPSHNIIVLE